MLRNARNQPQNHFEKTKREKYNYPFDGRKQTIIIKNHLDCWNNIRNYIN